MDIRTYQAKTMRDALHLVRRELGPGAAVLHSRPLRRGRLARLWQGEGVEVAATATPPAQLVEQAEVVWQRLAVQQQAARQASQITSPQPAPPQPSPSVPAQTVPAQPASQREPHSTPEPAVPETIKLPSLGDRVTARLDALEAEAAENRLSTQLDRLRESLLELGLEASLAQQWQDLAAEDFSEINEVDAELLNEHAIHFLATKLPTSNLLAQAAAAKDPQRPHVVALVGPAGVGKTTTLAKLAATLSVAHGRRVGLLTVDQYRVGAVDQLRTYAHLLGLPIEVAETSDDLKAAIHRLEGCEVILADTDGRSPRDAEGIARLGELLAAAAPDAVAMVLPASMPATHAPLLAEAFAPLAATELVVTKLDESPNDAPLWGLVNQLGLPLACTTDGQAVPEDLATADAEATARGLLSATLQS